MNALTRFSIFPIVALLMLACNDPKETDCIYQDERLCDPNFQLPEIADGIVELEQEITDYDSKVMLEDFTGFRCSNCPPATVTAANLKDDYPDRLSTIAVHCTNIFAAPSGDPGEPFSTEFRTPDGTEIFENFNIPNLPNGVINRLGNEFNSYIPFTEWTDRVDALLSTNNPEVYIDIRDVDVDVDAGEITVEVYAKPLIPSDEDYLINMSITENGLPEAQKDNDVDGGVIYDYTHNHVFRGSAYGPWGLDAFNGSINLNSNEVLAYTLTMDINSVWTLENCELLVFISKASNIEVVQVEERHLLD